MIRVLLTDEAAFYTTPNSSSTFWELVEVAEALEGGVAKRQVAQTLEAPQGTKLEFFSRSAAYYCFHLVCSVVY